MSTVSPRPTLRRCPRWSSARSITPSGTVARDTPAYTHPHFDTESRVVTAELDDIVVASMYLPNGGKDYPAKIAFMRQVIEWAGELIRGGRELLIAGDLNIARAEIDVHPRERKATKMG